MKKSRKDRTVYRVYEDENGNIIGTELVGVPWWLSVVISVIAVIVSIVKDFI
jgi:hypothetical protein